MCGVLDETPSESQLTPNLQSVCIPRLNGAVNAPEIIAQLEKWRPDRLILQAPDRTILKWALAQGIDTLPLLADSFEQKSLRNRFRAFRLARLLSHRDIRAVGNHNIPSCLSLKRIGVSADKVYPWDWPHELRPEAHMPKRLDKDRIRLVFVGSLTAAKGVGDCIEAARTLKNDGLKFEMTLAGGGDFSEQAQTMIREYSLSEQVHLAGRLPHDDIVDLLASATLSMAPSWHDYPEGLPMTIYEALATRTPLALSDHPMFQLYFRDTLATRMAREKNPAALAAAIKALIAEPETYAEASEATGALWNKIKCDLTWGALINAWLGENGASLYDIRHENLHARLAGLDA
ncbi:MAG: hypothetical protein DHS20C04_21130 [Hyphococcus sp.]|nr:MAG: hypothetical protein DHS20C04_21130 [Marinicaulis sp.]